MLLLPFSFSYSSYHNCAIVLVLVVLHLNVIQFVLVLIYDTILMLKSLLLF